MPPIALKPWYSLAEYARLCGESLAAVKRRADRGTLQVGRIGKKRVIFLSVLIAEKPDLYASIVAAEQFRAIVRGDHE